MKKAKERFKIIEIKVRRSEDLAPALNKKIKPSWHIIKADFLCAVGDWWFYNVIIDTQPTPKRAMRL